jgi:hypothetical protein
MILEITSFKKFRIFIHDFVPLGTDFLACPHPEVSLQVIFGNLLK